MKKIDLGQTISILANVGVIAGIIFLGIEINQNTASNQSAVRQSMAQSEITLLFNASENPDLLFDPGSLSADQFGSYQVVLTAYLRSRESYWLEYQNGLLDRETFESYLAPFVAMIGRTDFSRDWWRARVEAETLTRGFLEEVEGALEIRSENRGE